MTPARLWALAVVAAVVVARTFLHWRPTPSPTILGVRLHHWMTGLVFAVVGSFARAAVQSSPARVIATAVAGVGMGLFLDEATYLVLRGRSHADYVATLRPTAALVAVVAATCWAWG